MHTTILILKAPLPEIVCDPEKIPPVDAGEAGVGAPKPEIVGDAETGRRVDVDGKEVGAKLEIVGVPGTPPPMDGGWAGVENKSSEIVGESETSGPTDVGREELETEPPVKHCPPRQVKPRPAWQHPSPQGISWAVQDASQWIPSLEHAVPITQQPLPPGHGKAPG